MSSNMECCGWSAWGRLAGLESRDDEPGWTPHGDPARVVIVGGGFGGLATARALAGVDAAVTLIDRTNHHVFQPLLYQVASAALSPSEIAYPIRAVLRGQRNARVLLGDVTSIDLAGRVVRLGGGEGVPFDYLVLAPGARHAYFGHPAWETDAPGLKTLEDALEIRRRVLLAFERAERERDPLRRRALLTFVIVGGGPTGVELAGAIGEMACDVLRRDFRSFDTRRTRTVLVEAGPRLLPSFPPALSAGAAAMLRRRCVEVHTSTLVEEVEAGAVWMGGQRVAADTVLWAAGVAASPLVRTLGTAIDPSGRIPVDATLRPPGLRRVFVIGDAAAVAGPDGDRLPGLAPVAIQQGRHAAQAIARCIAGREPEPFAYRDRGMMATVGRGQAIATTRRIRLAGGAAWWLWLLVHLVWLIGFRNRIVVTLEWAWAYVTRQRSGRLILAPFERGGRAPEHAPRARAAAYRSTAA